MHNNLNPIKQEVPKEDLDKIQEGVNKAGNQAIKEMNEGIPRESQENGGTFGQIGSIP